MILEGDWQSAVCVLSLAHCAWGCQPSYPGPRRGAGLPGSTNDGHWDDYREHVLQSDFFNSQVHMKPFRYVWSSKMLHSIDDKVVNLCLCGYRGIKKWVLDHHATWALLWRHDVPEKSAGSICLSPLSDHQSPWTWSLLAPLFAHSQLSVTFTKVINFSYNRLRYYHIHPE